MGSFNTAYGFEALKNNSSGGLNTATGTHSMFVNSSGGQNTANGYDTLFNNTNGANNTAVGYGALAFNTVGNGNTAIGASSLSSNTTGTNNTVVGSNANVSAGSFVNATAIGSGAIVNASNKVRIGSAAVTVIEGQVAFTFPSDGRFKTAITESVKGLDFIMKLRPVLYNFQTEKYDRFINGEENKNIKAADTIDYTESEKIRHSGFIAQEVELAAKATGYDFDGIVIPKNNKEAYGLSYSQFVVPLVKAVQEQQLIINKQQTQINDLLKKLELLEKK